MMRGINHQNIFEDEEDNYQFINTLDRMRVRYDDEGNPCGSNCTYNSRVIGHVIESLIINGRLTGD